MPPPVPPLPRLTPLLPSKIDTTKGFTKIKIISIFLRNKHRKECEIVTVRQTMLTRRINIPAQIEFARFINA
jgi:hypothetical protein